MKYLAILLMIGLMGCASGVDSKGSSSHGRYLDYPYTNKDGVVMVHRIYSDDHQEWLTQAEEAAAK